MTELLRICTARDRRCPSAPKIRGESRAPIDKLGPITVVTATVPCRSFDFVSHAQLTGQCLWVSRPSQSQDASHHYFSLLTSGSQTRKLSKQPPMAAPLTCMCSIWRRDPYQTDATIQSEMERHGCIDDRETRTCAQQTSDPCDQTT